MAELTFWLASTFSGWTWNYICDLEMSIVYFLIEGSRLYGERQNKEAEKRVPKKGGRQSINSLSELKGLPGIKTIKKRR